MISVMKGFEMEIKRDYYLQQLIDRRENGLIKVITGIRRCGKSYLLFNIYYQYLLRSGVPSDRILRIALDNDESDALLDHHELGRYIRSLVNETDTWYIFLDEIQFVPDFEKVLNGLNRYPNLDIYVTGSNSKFLSSDILTEFRGRGDEVRVFPLSFREYLPAHTGTEHEAWSDYVTYGGMPLILTRKTDEQKAAYLKDLFRNVYIKDIVERNRLRGDQIMENLVDVLASSVGSLTNPAKLAQTFVSKGMGNVSEKTISSYISCLIDAFLLEKAVRYDVKGKKYIASPYKYYYTDVGLRNARLNFRQQEENHLMENIIFNEMLIRGFNVDVGIVAHEEKDEQKNRTVKKYEIDFVCNQGSRRYYIQSAFAMPDAEKLNQEQRPLLLSGDFFKKIIVAGNVLKPWHNENGILIIGITDFLLNSRSLDI